MILAFTLFVVFCFWLSLNSQKQNVILTISLLLIVVLIGFRNVLWNDTQGYIAAFRQAPDIWHFSIYSSDAVYKEKGYHFLASMVKTIWDNDRFYLLAMGALSMFLLYKILRNYCLLPLIGLCDYMGRFLLNRDFIQIRSSLAILIVIYSLKFVKERSFWKYFLCVLIASQFHQMAWIGLPFYFFNLIHFKNWHIVCGLVLAAVFSQTLGPSISNVVEKYSDDLDYATYTSGAYIEEALKLKNPMIYFQSAVLLLYCYFEGKIKKLSSYYSIYKNAYFYSTIILIFFCNYTALSGRTSTIFATVEIFMLPMMVFAFKKKLPRNLFLMSIGLIIIYFFAYKYTNEINNIKRAAELIIEFRYS